jgi:alkaline phosphatase D
MRREAAVENKTDRREFLKQALGTAVGVSNLKLLEHSAWAANTSRTWLGPEYWANPLQDWRLANGRIECVAAGGDRNVALLTREVAARSGELSISARLGQLESATAGFAGFRIGAKSHGEDYRATAIYGQGLNTGITAEGQLFIGSVEPSAPKIVWEGATELTLTARPSANRYHVSLRATRAGAAAVEVTRDVPADWLTGGVALVSSSAHVPDLPAELAPLKDFSFYPPQQQAGGNMRCWFSDWVIAGSKIDVHEDRAWGPVLFALYTVSRGTLKLSAQFPPLEDGEKTVALEIKRGGGAWHQVATAELNPDAWNAIFRVPGWNASEEASYRVVYDGHSYEGKIRRDPIAGEEVTVGLLTCCWDFGFPHNDFVKHLGYHKPDVLFWTGDQIYEPVGGFGAIQRRDPEFLKPAMLDFLRKWFVFGWATRDLLRDIPSVCMTDDHDMYHGNIWGCGGRPTNPGAGGAQQGTVQYRGSAYAQQDSGGYKMAPRWVNMVQQVQTGHLPDPFDPTPVLQNIGVYYTDLLWGGVSFAILEDRKWKSAPKEQLPGAEIVNGFAQNLNWNPATQSDVPTAELLGARQLDFLEAWAANWSNQTWMKFAVSQTIFSCLHTEPAGIHADDHDPENTIPAIGEYCKGDHVVADHDSGAWPQTGRNEAILLWRKGFAAHLCGDQHLGSMAHYGVSGYRDGVYSICTPAISNIWPRRWFPPTADGRNTGDFEDAFGNRVTVMAIANPALYPGGGIEGLRLRATGYTILRCNKAERTTKIEEWPRWVDPSQPGAKPFPGWPVKIQQIDNGLWGAGWELEAIETPEFADPVVQVRNAHDGSVVYTLRIRGHAFTPLVREPGTYVVRAFDPDGFFFKEKKGQVARKRG